LRLPSTYSWPASSSAKTATDWHNRWFGWQQWYAHDPAATSGTSARIIAHVHGLSTNAWSVGSVTWTNGPNLGDPLATISTINKNYVADLGVSAEIIGQFAATGTEQLLQVDVSRWVAERMAAGATNLTFMIARQIRYDGDIDGSQSLAIRSGEYAAGAYAPTLTIAAVPEPSAFIVTVAAPVLMMLRRGRPRVPSSIVTWSRGRRKQ
jgi:hypothetical protein